MEHNDVIEAMRRLMPDAPVTLPPRCYEDLEARILNYEEGTSIEISVPLQEKFNNPAGIILGGYIPTFFDLAFGPLSYLVAKRPTTTLDLNTTFIRPITVRHEAIRVRARVVNRGKTYLVLDGQAYNAGDALVATATSRLQLLG